MRVDARHQADARRCGSKRKCPKGADAGVRRRERGRADGALWSSVWFPCELLPSAGPGRLAVQKEGLRAARRFSPIALKHLCAQT